MENIKSILQKMEKIVEEEWDKTNSPGLAVGIVKDGKLVQSHCLGNANVEKKQEITEDTVFMFGSITKPFTTVAAMQQYEQGKFQLDDSINKYLPDDHGKIIVKKGWPEVTFRDLLTHTSGIGELRMGRDIFTRGYKLITYDDTPTKPLREFHKLPLPSYQCPIETPHSNCILCLFQ